MDLYIDRPENITESTMPIKCCCLCLVNDGLFSFLNIKKVKI